MRKLEYFIRATETSSEAKYTFAPDSLLTDALRTSYLLPLFGWRHLTTETDENALKCHHCLHEINLAGLQNPFLNDDASTTKFDVVRGHRDYCPWVNRRQALVKTPRRFALNKEAPLCGYEWMIQIVEIEYSFLMQMRETSAAYRESRIKYLRDSRMQFRETGKALMARLRQMGSTLKSEESKNPDQLQSQEVDVEINTTADILKGEKQQAEIDHVENGERLAQEEQFDVSSGFGEKVTAQSNESMENLTVEQPKKEDTVEDQTKEVPEIIELDMEVETVEERKTGETTEEGLQAIEDQVHDLTELEETAAAELGDTSVEGMQGENIEISEQEAGLLEQEYTDIPANAVTDKGLEVPEAEEEGQLPETVNVDNQVQDEHAVTVDLTEEGEVQQEDQASVQEIHETNVRPSADVASAEDELAEFASTPGGNLQDDEALLDATAGELQTASPLISVSPAAGTPSPIQAAQPDEELEEEEIREEESAEVADVTTPQVLGDEFDADDILKTEDVDEDTRKVEMEHLETDATEMTAEVADNASEETLEAATAAEETVQASDAKLESDKTEHEEKQPAAEEVEVEPSEQEPTAEEGELEPSEQQPTAEEDELEPSEQQDEADGDEDLPEQQIESDGKEALETPNFDNEDLEEEEASENKISNADTRNEHQEESTEAQSVEQTNDHAEAHEDGELIDAAESAEEGYVPSPSADNQEDSVVPLSDEADVLPQKGATDVIDLTELDEDGVQGSENGVEADGDEKKETEAIAETSSEVIQDDKEADEQDDMEEDRLEDSQALPEETDEKMDIGIDEDAAEVNEEMDGTTEQIGENVDDMELLEDEKAVNDMSADIDVDVEDKDASIVIEEATTSDEVVNTSVTNDAEEFQESNLIDVDVEKD